MYLATQLFSNSVGKAMGRELPRRQGQAEAILEVDRWFDVMNSRSKFDARLERCAFGATSDALSAQEAALDNMERLVAGTRKFSMKNSAGRDSLLPFQHGILRSIRSLRGLFSELKETLPEFKYLLAVKLCQDCLENAFSQIRGMGGQNQHPDAVEVRCRLRFLLMAASTLIAADSRGRAVQMEEDQQFLTTDAPENLTNIAFSGLNFEVSSR